MRKTSMAAAGLAALAITGGPALAQSDDQPQEPITQRHDTMESAVGTPAEDLNLKHIPIPEVLQRAAVNPYDMRTLEACDAVAAEVQRLDAALGADRDEPPVRDTRTLDEKRDSTAASALKLGIEAVTPYRGIVRWVTGADAHDKVVQDTIEAGFARRGFLKGMAVKMNCAPPAAPAWYRPTQAAPARTTAQYQPYPAYQSSYPSYSSYPASTPTPAYAARRYDPYAQSSRDGYGQAYAPYPDDRTYPADDYRDYRDYRSDPYGR